MANFADAHTWLACLFPSPAVPKILTPMVHVPAVYLGSAFVPILAFLPFFGINKLRALSGRGVRRKPYRFRAMSILVEIVSLEE